MGRPSFYHFLCLFACLFAAPLQAADDLLQPLRDSVTTAATKAMLVVEFGTPAPEGSKLSDAIQQAKREFQNVQSTVLADERGLEKALENKSDVGMVVLIHPQDMEALGKLPALYPDIVFTVIDIVQPLFAANVQSVQFKEEEGAFLLGAIAAIKSTDRITIMALEEDARSKHMATTFARGVKHIRPNANVAMLMNIRPSATQRTRLASTVSTAFQEGTGIIFSMDDEIVEQALRAAKPERKLVISGNAPPAGSDTTRLITYMVKRYDLALLDVLRIYTHKQWHNGTISLGVSGGYLDYSLNADNVEVFPKDSIDQIEAIKDHIGQGTVGQKP